VLSASRIHLGRRCMCTGAVSEERPWTASLLQINVSTHRYLLGVIALNVATILSIIL
jgi:hypothetical protein